MRWWTLLAGAGILTIAACDMKTTPGEVTHEQGPPNRAVTDSKDVGKTEELRGKLEAMERELASLREGEQGEACGPQAQKLQRLLDDAQASLLDEDRYERALR